MAALLSPCPHVRWLVPACGSSEMLIPTMGAVGQPEYLAIKDLPSVKNLPLAPATQPPPGAVGTWLSMSPARDMASSCTPWGILTKPGQSCPPFTCTNLSFKPPERSGCSIFSV